MINARMKKKYKKKKKKKKKQKKKKKTIKLALRVFFRFMNRACNIFNIWIFATIQICQIALNIGQRR